MTLETIIQEIGLYLPAVVALVSFSIFVGYGLFFRLTSGETASRELMKAHLQLSLLYVALAMTLHFSYHPNVGFGDWAVGAFMYFGLHYAFFLYLHAVPRKSVSVNLCVTISQEPMGTTREALSAGYGQGKGMDFIIQDRVSSMEHMGFIESKAGLVRLTPFGLFVAKVHLLVLRIWGMRSNSGAENA